MVSQLAARQSKCLCRHQHCRSESAASHLLAIATMTFEHHDWPCITFVTNRPARAAAGKRCFHGPCFASYLVLGLELWFSEQSLSLMFVFRYFVFVSGSMIP